MNCTVISIINNKGGTGKTTTAVNLGYALAAKENKKVLVIDNDPQCNATAKLLSDVKVTYSLFEAIDPRTEPIDISYCIYTTTQNENLFCLPNVDVTSGHESRIALSKDENKFNIMRDRVIRDVCKQFDVILIDNPPNLGTFVLCSLCASNFVIVPHKSDSSDSVQGLLSAIRFIDEVRESLNPNIRFLRLLITQVDRRMAVTKAIIDRIGVFFNKDQVFKTRIPINAAFTRAELYNQSVFKYRPQARGASAYKDLAHELCSIIDKTRRNSHEQEAAASDQ